MSRLGENRVPTLSRVPGYFVGCSAIGIINSGLGSVGWENQGKLWAGLIRFSRSWLTRPILEILYYFRDLLSLFHHG